MPLSDSVLEALARLERNTDFLTVIEHVKAMLKEAESSLKQVADLIEVGRYQGECRALEELLRQAGSAHDLLIKRRRG